MRKRKIAEGIKVHIRDLNYNKVNTAMERSNHMSPLKTEILQK